MTRMKSLNDQTSITLHPAGVPVTITGLTDGEHDELLRVWARCCPVSATATAGTLTREEAPSPVPRNPSLPWAGMQESVVSEATRRVIAHGVGRSLMLHAAGLCDPSTGRTIALVAPSGGGKTTATARLARTWGYVTDETVIIDPVSLTVTPYPKPLSVLPESGVWPKAVHGPDELGLNPTPREAGLHAVVLLDRRGPGAPENVDAPVEVKELSLMDALVGLIPQTSSLARLPRGLSLLCDMISRLGVHVVRYREASTLLPALAPLMSGELMSDDSMSDGENSGTADHAENRSENRSQNHAGGHGEGHGGERHGDDLPGRTWQPVPECELDPGDSPASGPGLVRRAPLDDAVWLHDGSLAVLRGEQFLVLSPLAAIAWTHAHAWVDPRVVTDRILAGAARGPGDPVDAAGHVTRAVESLTERGVLVRS